MGPAPTSSPATLPRPELDRRLGEAWSEMAERASPDRATSLREAARTAYVDLARSLAALPATRATPMPRPGTSLGS
jgi:hypothetical protein